MRRNAILPVVIFLVAVIAAVLLDRDKSMQLLISIQSSEPWYHKKEYKQPTGLPPGTPGATTALMIGDVGCAYIFICRECPDWPIVALMQCS